MADRSTRPIGRAPLNFAILTHGALAATQRCLQSLAATVPQPFQVFVVDNASTDGTVDWLRRRQEPWLHWRANAHNRGVPGGRNDLLEFALPHLGATDFLVFCDNDLEFEPGWLQRFAAAQQRFPDAALLGQVGHLVEVHGCRRVLLPSPRVPSRVDVLSGGFACFVRADAAAAIGRFDEELGLFWHEDDDYCVRALQLGLEVVAVPGAGVVHHEHGSGAAAPGLREGGSLRNQQYLAARWRAAGWVDAGGWIRRPHPGCYQPPEVRDELRRRGGLRSPVGRAEYAAAFALIDRLVTADDPAREFTARREPRPRCMAALLQWNRECAAGAGDLALVARLDEVAAVLQRHGWSSVLAPAVRSPDPQADGPVGHGLCRASDFDDPDWLRMADAYEPGHCARDPNGRDRGFWEQVSLSCALEREGAVHRRAKVLLVGEPPERLQWWLGSRCGSVAVFDEREPPPPASQDVVVFLRATDPDLVATASACASHAALFAFAGDVVLDGAPVRSRPTPAQIEHDLLARAGLRPVTALRTVVDDEVLEACRGPDDPESARPQLTTFVGGRLVTSFVACARRAPREGPVGSRRSVLDPRRRPRAVVGVDLRTMAYADSSSRGIGHYTAHHLAAVARQAPDLELRCYVQPGGALPERLQLPNVTAASLDEWDPASVDLVHLPDPMNLSLGYDSPLRVFRHPRTTVTFHDLTPLRHYVERWPRRNRDAYLDRLRQIERGAAHLLCNSRFTTEDVVRTLRRDASTVTPILAGCNGSPAPVDEAQRQRVRRRLGVDGPFLLHVGALDPHKNFPEALSAFLRVRRHRPLQLVVVGAVDAGIEHFAAFCARRRIRDVVFTGWLPRRDLDALYQEAVALLFLSASEGFGFPLLEAMAAGCPVVGSDATSHPEVVGDAGMLVPLDDVAEHAAAAVESLAGDPALADELRRRGRARALQFGWDAVAERTLAVWRSMLATASERAASSPGSVAARPPSPTPSS